MAMGAMIIQPRPTGTKNNISAGNRMPSEMATNAGPTIRIACRRVSGSKRVTTVIAAPKRKAISSPDCTTGTQSAGCSLVLTALRIRLLNPVRASRTKMIRALPMPSQSITRRNLFTITLFQLQPHHIIQFRRARRPPKRLCDSVTMRDARFNVSHFLFGEPAFERFEQLASDAARLPMRVHCQIAYQAVTFRQQRRGVRDDTADDIT